MKKRKFKKELYEAMTSAPMELPASLSAENMEKFLEENKETTATVSRFVPQEKKKKKAPRAMAYAAAAVAVVTGLSVLLSVTVTDIRSRLRDDAIVQKTESSDYSVIEAAVLQSFKSYLEQSEELNMSFGSHDNTDRLTMNPESAVDQAGGSVANDVNISETNTQVVGVDEADIIKNDGRYIYYLSENCIYITDTANPNSMSVTSVIDYNKKNDGSYVYDMFLYNNQLAVISQIPRESGAVQDYAENAVAEIAGDSLVMNLCCYIAPADTMLTVYNLSDIKNPTESFTYTISGQYVSSRMIDSRLLLVTDFILDYAPYGSYSFDEACDIIKDNSVPVYSVNGGDSKRIPSSSIKITDENNIESYVVASMTDLNDLTEEPKASASIGGAGEIYCTADALFVARTVYEEQGSYDLSTTIYKFAIGKDGAVYETEAGVPGRWLNQFSMDYYNGYFRIATTAFNRKSQQQENMVYTLDKALKQVGKLTGIAPGESIEAARFMGDVLYLVTFYQTDPLFVIDLSDPAAPTIQGELKIPGFSSYLHPIGNGLVLGIGTGGDAQGVDGTAKISLFDVSDPMEPKELDNLTPGSGYIDSSHKAFTVIDDNTFALCFYRSTYDHESCEIITVDVENGGIKLTGSFSPAAETYDWNIRCAFTGDSIFAVSNTGIAAYSMTRGEKLGEVKF